jgi:hypothetical protein
MSNIQTKQEWIFERESAIYQPCAETVGGTVVRAKWAVTTFQPKFDHVWLTYQEDNTENYNMVGWYSRKSNLFERFTLVLFVFRLKSSDGSLCSNHSAAHCFSTWLIYSGFPFNWGWGGGLSGYNTERLVSDNSGYRVWRLLLSLYVTYVFCRFWKSVGA